MTADGILVALGQLPVDSFSVLALAATWVLVSLGLHLTFGLLGVVNLAHGEFLLVGAYSVVLVHAVTGSVVLGMLLAGPITAAVGWVVERSLLRNLAGRPLDTLLATFGVAMILRQGIQLLAGPNLRAVADPVNTTFRWGSLLVPGWRLTVVLVTVAVAVAMWFLLDRTMTGVRWRAVTGNPDLAVTLATDVPRVRTAIFAGGAGLTGLAGALLAPLSSVSPQYGTRFLVPAFVIVILGGVGSFHGLLVAGTLLGLSLGVIQFVVDPVTAQMAVLLLAVVLLRSARRGNAWDSFSSPTR